jgi:prepilin-type N-terminal cleavage/methylation domain-containing protein
MNGRPPSGSTSTGFTLVETLIALSLGAVLLAGAWSWVWAVTSAGARAADMVEACTTLAFARRILLADVRAAGGLAPDLPSSATSLALAVSPRRRADGRVDVHWDEGRGVLWRLAAGCHLADGVDLFQVTYLDADGEEIACGREPLSADAAASVRGLIIRLRVRAGGTVAHGRWPVWLTHPER